jgi:hypothetical protein
LNVELICALYQDTYLSSVEAEDQRIERIIFSLYFKVLGLKYYALFLALGLYSAELKLLKKLGHV